MTPEQPSKDILDFAAAENIEVFHFQVTLVDFYLCISYKKSMINPSPTLNLSLQQQMVQGLTASKLLFNTHFLQHQSIDML
jgi:hypothetical protein